MSLNNLDWIKESKIKWIVERDWEEYKRKIPTLCRLPWKQDLWRELITYVSKNWRIVEESKTKIKRNDVIVRNPFAIDKERKVYNEWCIPRNRRIKAYWKMPLSKDLRLFRRRKNIKATNVNEKILKILWACEWECYAKLAHFRSNWWFHLEIWDYIAEDCSGNLYVIDKEQFELTYEKIREWTRKRFNSTLKSV